MTLFLVSLCFGLFIASLVWQAWTLARGVPRDDRQFLDRPAIGFRLVWPLIRVLVHHGGRFVGEAQRESTTARLRRGGVEYGVSALEFIAAQCIAATGFGAGVAGFAGMLGGPALALFPLGAVMGFFYPELWLRETTARRATAILKTLPFYLDVVTLSVEAGSNLTGGLTQVVQKSTDSPLRREFGRVLRDIRAGRTRAEALRDMADRTGGRAMQNLVSSLIQAERTGASLGPLLRAQAEQLRSERFQRAEKQAMEAPVKLLGPLVLFIFPTTFLVLTFLILSKALQEGLVPWGPLLMAYQWPGT